jgi:hypothetical protein
MIGISVAWATAKSALSATLLGGLNLSTLERGAGLLRLFRALFSFGLV